MTNLLADLRFFCRRFTRRPAVLTTALALGMSARPADIAALVMRQGGRLLLIAVVIGLPSAFVVSRLA